MTALEQAREALRALMDGSERSALSPDRWGSIHMPTDDAMNKGAAALAAIDAALSAQEVPAGEWADSPTIDASWQAFCRTAAYRQALGWVKDDEVPGALFVAFRAGLQYTAAPAAPKQAEAQTLPELRLEYEDDETVDIYFAGTHVGRATYDAHGSEGMRAMCELALAMCAALAAPAAPQD